MLNFSKINTLIIYFIFFFIAFFSSLNFQNNENLLIDKKINLGLDLQGGSYLLLSSFYYLYEKLETYERNNDLVQAKLALGQVYLDFGQIEKSEKYFKQAILASPNSQVSARVYASSKMRQGKLNKAKKIIQLLSTGIFQTINQIKNLLTITKRN